MKKVFFCFFILLVFASIQLNAQKSRTDSLYKALIIADVDTTRLYLLNELGIYLRRSFPDSALSFAHQAESLAIKLNDKHYLAESYKSIGNIYNGKDNFLQTDYYYQKSLEIYIEIGDTMGLAKIYNNMGALYRNRGDLAKSLEYYQISLDFRFKMNDRFGMGMTYNNIGNLHHCQGNLDLSLEYYNKSLEIRKEFDDRMGMAGCFNNIGSTYSDKQEYEKGISYFNQAIEIYEEYNDKLGISNCYKNIGSTYLKLGDYEQALIYFKRSLVIYEELGDQLGIANSLIKIAEGYNKSEKYNEAKNYALKALNISIEVGSMIEKKDAHEQINMAYEGLGDYKNALYYHKQFLSVKDSLLNLDKIKEIESIESRYQLENKQLQIEKLESENKLKNLKLNNLRNLQFLSFIIILISIGFIIGLLDVRKKLNKKSKTIFEQNKKISLQKEQLENHRKNLEVLVEERTQELIIAKEKAEESDRLKSSFLANMSHEIRTPLNAIIGFSNLINEDSIDPVTKREISNEISNKGHKLVQLIENILDLAKIESNQLKFNFSDISINEILTSIEFSFREEIKNQDLSFKISKPSVDDLIIYSDSYRLKQVLFYLVDNAIKYTDEGSIEIGYNLKEISGKGMLTFFVKDTGIGISKDRMNSIFQRFTKIEDDKKKLYGGAGLGLTIAKSIVSHLDGELKVESEINKGSNFYFTIPVRTFSRNKPLNHQKLQNKDYNWANKTMLIAEDDESNFRFFELMLQETNINIVHADNGEKALELYKSNDIDIILMDIKMPKKDGLEVTKIIRKSNTNVPIIAQTAFAMENDEKLSINAGCNEYIQKPIQKSTLLLTLDKYLAG